MNKKNLNKRKKPTPKKVAAGANQADGKDMLAPGPNFFLDTVKFKELVNAVRINIMVDRIKNTCLSDAEQQKILDEGLIDADIIDIWVKIRGVSPTRAVLEMAYKVDLLTKRGLHRLLCSFGEEEVKSAEFPYPEWNEQLGELRLGNTMIKRVRQLKEANNVASILNRFQASGWPYCIGNPLPFRKNLRQSPARRLRDAINSLNENLKLIQFHIAKHGREIAWERV